MSTNCLVTKLKSVVANDNLPELGKISLRANKKTTITAPEKEQVILLSYESGTTGEISVESPGALGNNPATVDQSTTQSVSINHQETLVAFKNENYKIDVSDKYKLTKFYGRAESGKIAIFSFDLSVFDYAEKLRYLRIAYFKNISGSIESLKHCELLTNISLFSDDNITGNIEKLNKLISLTELNLAWTKCTGEINTFAAAQVANGRTSGSLAIGCNGIVTLNGSIVGNNVTKTITFDSSLPNGYSVS